MSFLTGGKLVIGDSRRLFVDPAGSNITGVQYQTINEAFDFLTTQEYSYSVYLKDGVTHSLIGDVTLPTIEHPIIGISKTTTEVANGAYSFQMGQFGVGAFHRFKAVMTTGSDRFINGNQHGNTAGEGSLKIHNVDFATSGTYNVNCIQLTTGQIEITNTTLNAINGMAASDLWCDRLKIDGFTITGTSTLGELLSICAGPKFSKAEYDDYAWDINNLSVVGTNMAAGAPLMYLQTSNIPHAKDKFALVKNSTIKSVGALAGHAAVLVNGATDKKLCVDFVDCIIDVDNVAANCYEIYKDVTVANVVVSQTRTTKVDLSACRTGP